MTGGGLFTNYRLNTITPHFLHQTAPYDVSQFIALLTLHEPLLAFHSSYLVKASQYVQLYGGIQSQNMPEGHS